MAIKPTTLRRVLAASFSRPDMPVLVSGAPGIGKTEIVVQSADDAACDLIVSHPVVSDPTDFKGMPAVLPDAAMATFLPFDDLAHAMHVTRPTVWFFDDLGQASSSVQAAAMQLFLARRINGKRLPDFIRFAAATNRRQDRAGVTGILEPVKSRFATIVELEPCVDALTAHAARAGWAPEVIAFLRLRPELVADFKPTPDLQNSPSPRTWSFVSRWLQMGLDARDERAVYSGAVGDGAAGEFIAFLHVYRNAPTPDVIVLNPTTAPVPDKASLMHAVCSALAHYATAKNFGRILQYLDRVPQEFAVFAVKDAARRNPDVCTSPAWLTYVQSDIGKLVMGTDE